jgi:hypothetical protein
MDFIIFIIYYLGTSVWLVDVIIVLFFPFFSSQPLLRKESPILGKERIRRKINTRGKGQCGALALRVQLSWSGC